MSDVVELCSDGFFKVWDDLLWYVTHEMDDLVIEVVATRRGRFIEFEARENDGGVIQVRFLPADTVPLSLDAYEQMLLLACVRVAVRGRPGCAS